MVKRFEIVFVLVLFALAVFVIFPTINKYTNCFAKASGKIEQMPSPSEVGKEVFCQNGQEIILSLNSCLDEAKSSNIFAPLLFRLALLFPQTKGASTEIDKHNQVCPDYPVAQPF